MSDKQDTTKQESSSQDQVGGKPQPKKRTNKIKETARAKFNASAPPISAEKFFTEFIEKKRNNVEIKFDTGVQGRLAEPYIVKARNHAQNKLNAEVDNVNLQCSTFALISMALCRKMLLAVPDSEEYELGRFKDIRRTELMAPKSAIAAIANVGKFEFEDKVARLKYNSQDIFRMMMTMCKVMNHHSDYEASFAPPVQDITWDDLDVNQLVITSESSVRWIRDEAAAYLDRAYMNSWEVTYQPPAPAADAEELPLVQGGAAVAAAPAPPAPVRMRCSYPRLPISPDQEQQMRNVVAWLALLDENMPGVEYVVAAGFATCWKLVFFQRIGHLLRNLIPNLPAWVDLRPWDVLTRLGLHHCEISTDDYDGTSYIGFVKEIHHHVILNNTLFAEFLDLAKQPDDKFGSVAQMLPYKATDFQERAFVGLEDFSYQRLRPDAQSVCINKIQDKGAVTVGLVFGFSRDVKVVDNYIGRLNGDPNNVRLQYLKSDLKFGI